MKSVTVFGFLVLATLSPATAIEADQAKELLAGTWTSVIGTETWVFSEDGAWQQFSGGITREASYSVESMPANLFTLISSSGRRFVVHVSPDQNSLQLFVEGTVDQAGSFSRLRE